MVLTFDSEHIPILPSLEGTSIPVLNSSEGHKNLTFCNVIMLLCNVYALFRNVDTNCV